ncbi:Coiled-coil domain-containing protein [Canna indica]|uniref:Coiled-coil domain-containing protein n=1 Tax=Canna indica TaxID=4628 RepID=A0AAQ3KSU5_9LILI|nr:Coiled-coil domain-containing protein [Canna indica]
MERRMRAGSPAYSRQLSGTSSGGSESSSPAISPGHHRSASASSFTGFRRNQNLAAKAANARLARVMASQAADEEEEDDDLFPAGGDGGLQGGIRFSLTRPVASSNGGTSLLGRSARSPSPALNRNIIEPPPSSRSASAGRTTLSVRTAPMVPPIKTTLRTPSPIPAIDPPADRRRDRRYFSDMGHLNSRDQGDHRQASALQDKLDMLEEENYSLLEKMQLAEERCKEAEARSRELEKQVANLGEGVSLEARLISRKEAALRQREEAMKAAMRMKDDKGEELTALQQQVQSARDEVADTREQLKDAESEVKALRSMTQRMILTQEEMEEVVLKRCWLARYWALAVRHGIYPEIATTKHEYWSSLAPLPLEVVTSAGQRAKYDSWSDGYNDADKNKLDRDISDTTAEGNIENMLAVEKGLRELASLKVEDAVVLVLAQHRRPSLLRLSDTDLRSPGDPKFMDDSELSQEEAEDVLFKQSWLTYFWRRAKTHGVEEDIAEERLQFWIGRLGQSPTSHDVVDVERGLVELRKLSIEHQLWEASRNENDTHQKTSADEEHS